MFFALICLSVCLCVSGNCDVFGREPDVTSGE